MKRILCLVLSSLLLLTGCAKEEETPVIPDEVTVINVEITPPPVNESYIVMIGEEDIILHTEEEITISVPFANMSESTDGKVKLTFANEDSTEVSEKEGYLSKNEDGTYQFGTEVKKDSYISFADFKLENEELFFVEEIPTMEDAIVNTPIESMDESTDSTEIIEDESESED